MPEVLKQLRAQAAAGRPVAAQIFLNDDAPTESLPELAQQIVQGAMKEVGKHAVADVRKIHRLAKSFSVVADVDTLAAVAGNPGVKTILPSEVGDVFPRPVKPAKD